MTARQPRDIREDAKTVIANTARRAGHAAPDAFALELLVALDGAHIGLTDTTPPTDPNADWRPPPNTTPAAAASPGTSAYQAARAALRGTTTDTAPEQP